MFPYRDNLPLARTPIVTYLLIAVNAAVLWAMSSLPEQQHDDAVYRHGFVSARVEQLAHGRPLKVVIPVVEDVPLIGPVAGHRALELPADPNRDPGVVLHVDVHAWQSPALVEQHVVPVALRRQRRRSPGRFTFLTYYFVGGLAATACQWAYDPHATVPMVGASGAVAAVLGGYAITWPHARIRSLLILFIFVTTVELPALLFLGGWFVLQLIEAARPHGFGVAGGVAWWAHVGGFVAGLIMMPLLSGLRPAAVQKERFDIEEF